jgi:hypothetical protein
MARPRGHSDILRCRMPHLLRISLKHAPPAEGLRYPFSVPQIRTLSPVMSTPGEARMCASPSLTMCCAPQEVRPAALFRRRPVASRR